MNEQTLSQNDTRHDGIPIMRHGFMLDGLLDLIDRIRLDFGNTNSMVEVGSFNGSNYL